MNYISVFLSLLFAYSLHSCKAQKNQSFIEREKERTIVLSYPPAPHVLFLLESGDTLKFSTRDVISLIDRKISNEIKNLGYISNKSSEQLAKDLKRIDRDTLVIQRLSAVDNKTISGALDSWIAHELLLKGKAEILLKDSAFNPSEIKYIFTKDYLGGKQGTFLTKNNRKIYWTIISFGE